MIQTIDRRDVFNRYPVIRSLIADFQQQFFDPEYNDPKDTRYDALEESVSSDELYHGNFVSMLPHEDLVQYPKDLEIRLRLLLASLGCSRLMLLSFIKVDLCGHVAYQDVELLDARQVLSSITGKSEYGEALRLHLEDLGNILPIFFWLHRLDPDFPAYVFWVDEGEQFCFYCCDRGNLHWLSLATTCSLSKSLLQEYGFKVGYDFDQFG